MERRAFSHTALVSALATVLRAAPAGRRPRILLRSSWQVVNIGDIAHTPGVLALLEQHLPEAEVRLWASADLSDEVAAMEHRRFPSLRIVKGTVGPDGRASDAHLAETLEWCDFLLHGSGPSLVAAADVAAFLKHFKKPFGVYGITHGSFLSGGDAGLLSSARFVFFRDSVSLERARADGVRSPVMEFGPDGAFACDLRDDARAEAFLKEHGLEPGRFLCCIPRLRYTPYWLIRPGAVRDEKRAARNDEMAEHDHAPLREAIASLVRDTEMRVLLCPEDRTQMEVGQRWVLERLAPEVRTRVVWRERFWLTDEAVSTYVRSAGLFGLEMHSPILCVGNGVPAIVGRFAEQTSKGVMWRDIGLGDWLFDFDAPEDVRRYAPAVLAMARDPVAARERVARAQRFVRERQRATMDVLGRSLPSGSAAGRRR
jgi:hypothetical protein